MVQDQLSMHGAKPIGGMPLMRSFAKVVLVSARPNHQCRRGYQEEGRPLDYVQTLEHRASDFDPECRALQFGVLQR
jgi:hypothetical protein